MLTLPLRKELFWDIDLDSLDVDKNARFVIVRVFKNGNLEELQTLLKYYGREKITSQIITAPSLDEKTLAFASVLLGIPKERFRCYMR